MIMKSITRLGYPDEHSFIPPEKGGGGGFGSSEIGGGGVALISGFWGDLEKRGEKNNSGGLRV